MPRFQSFQPHRSLRLRIVCVAIVLTVLGLGVAGTLTFSIMSNRYEERVVRELEQEIDELQAIADHRSATGDPFRDVTSLLETATKAAVPSRHESVLALTNEQPKFRPQPQDFDLTTDAVISVIREEHTPGETVFATAHSPQYGELRLIIASVTVDGDPTVGTYVVAYAVEEERQVLWQTASFYGVISFLTLLLVGIAAWIVMGKIIRPLESLTQATKHVTVDDLGKRVEVPNADNEVTVLATQFNSMLERLEAGYINQRQFLRDSGHELRTPITIVRGTVEMLDADDEDFDESKEIALEELDRMARIVADLSVLAQAEQPDFVHLKSENTRSFAEAALSTVKRIDKRPWKLTTVVDTTAYFDRQRMMQAVVQLATNAVQYSDANSDIELSIEAQNDQQHVVFSVRDYGCGISPEDHERIFERFIRAGQSRSIGNSGLGLSIVSAIAEAHGGSVEVESALGKGSRFSIVIPRVPVKGTGG